jgi:hypothetical protein
MNILKPIILVIFGLQTILCNMYVRTYVCMYVHVCRMRMHNVKTTFQKLLCMPWEAVIQTTLTSKGTCT